MRVYDGSHPRHRRRRLDPRAVPVAGTRPSSREHWEEGLGGVRNGLYGYRISELEIYNPDNPVKRDGMARLLADADYLVFYSNRMYGTIPRLPRALPPPPAIIYHALVPRRAWLRARPLRDRLPQPLRRLPQATTPSADPASPSPPRAPGLQAERRRPQPRLRRRKLQRLRPPPSCSSSKRRSMARCRSSSTSIAPTSLGARRRRSPVGSDAPAPLRRRRPHPTGGRHLVGHLQSGLVRQQDSRGCLVSRRAARLPPPPCPSP